MNFASMTFWLALAGGFLVLSLMRFFVKAPVFDRVAFVVLSLFLLGVESLETVGVFLWVASVGYAGLYFRAKWSLWVVGLLMLAPLFYYKYSGFFGEVFSGESPAVRLLIPMGISFYTFQIFSFVIDSRVKNLPRPSVLDFLNFASFFPQIVAGPIERRSDLLPQVKNLRFRLEREAVEAGIPWVVLGLFFKMVLAENFALLDEELNPTSRNAVKVWVEASFFAGRIYFDFAGYSFIALGLARCFGVRLTLNFRSPYLARNLQEFWRQWHVTLSRWFRDYLYLPLGGRKCWFWGGNILVVFLVSGLWHGAGWGFLVWGLLHGAGVFLCALMGGRTLPGLVSWAITFVFVTLAWIFFMEGDWATSLAKVKILATPGDYQLGKDSILAIFEGPKTVILAAMMMVVAGAVAIGEWWSLRQGDCYAIFLNRWVQLLLIAGIFFLSPAKESRFIYFNF